MTLIAADRLVRGTLTCMIAELGHAPSVDELARRVDMTRDEAVASLRRLHAAHALLLHPYGVKPWVVHPFALTASACWVQCESQGYWASCLYCAFGVAAALDTDAVISTRLGSESETAQYHIRDGALMEAEGVFHLSIPPSRWWNNVIEACASFQPFRQEGDVEGWCARHGMPRGETMSLPGLWAFAQDWYGSYLSSPWKERSKEQARAIFERHGLVSEFWRS